MDAEFPTLAPARSALVADTAGDWESVYQHSSLFVNKMLKLP